MLNLSLNVYNENSCLVFSFFFHDASGKYEFIVHKLTARSYNILSTPR